MKKVTVITFLLTGLGLLSAQWWWIVVLPAAWAAFTTQPLSRTCLWAATSGFLAWGGCAGFLYVASADIIAARVANIMSLPGSLFAIALTALIGSAAATGAAFAGYLLRGMRAD